MLAGHKGHAGFKVLLSLAGEAHDHISGKADVFRAERRPQLGSNIGKLGGGIGAAHSTQGLVAAALQAQMELRTKFLYRRHSGDDLIVQHIRVKATQADALDAFDLGGFLDQLHQAGAGFFHSGRLKMMMAVSTTSLYPAAARRRSSSRMLSSSRLRTGPRARGMTQ